MDCTAEVVGDTTHTIDVADGDTYGDLLTAVGLSTHEATVLVDDTPVPEDQPIETDHVRILRLIKGG
ncbi:ubiquitin-like small modifier protein SAMP2 [Halocatena halophila]|uniref:ubiquitin-like small modifier protein SAMP2 n=1 Tax=Halocatena halophila TaxID=2814576 RepID=UPI002ED3ECD5